MEEGSTATNPDQLVDATDGNVYEGLGGFAGLQADLEEFRELPARKVIDMLVEYAESGASIDSSIVEMLIQQSSPIERELRELEAAALRGIKEQELNRLSSSTDTVEREKFAYEEVLSFVRAKLRENVK